MRWRSRSIGPLLLGRSARALAFALPVLTLGCNAFLGLDPGKIKSESSSGSGGSGGGSSGDAAGTGGGTCAPGGACPTLVWARAFGDATTQAVVTSLAVDAQDSLILAGYFGPTLSFGSSTLLSLGAWDFFVAKLDSTGQPVWARGFGSVSNNGETHPIRLALDAKGSIFLAGGLSGAVDFGGGQLSPAAPKLADFDVFVAKLDGGGIHQWSTRFISPQDQIATGVALDPAGNVVIAGWFQGDLDLGGGSLAGATSGAENGFLAKLSGADGSHVWSRGLDSAQSVDVGGLATDAAGNLVVAGHLGGSVDLGGPPLSGDGLYVARFDSLGTYVWGKASAATGTSFANGAALDVSGDPIVTGGFGGTIKFGTTPVLSDGNGTSNYVVKLDPAGDAKWSMRLPTTAVAADSGANVLVAGSFAGTVDIAGRALTSAGGTADMVIAKLDPNGGLIWSNRFGDTTNQIATAVAVVPGSNRVVLAGHGGGTVDFGAGSIMGGGSWNMFIAEFEP